MHPTEAEMLSTGRKLGRYRRRNAILQPVESGKMKKTGAIVQYQQNGAEFFGMEKPVIYAFFILLLKIYDIMLLTVVPTMHRQ